MANPCPPTLHMNRQADKFVCILRNVTNKVMNESIMNASQEEDGFERVFHDGGVEEVPAPRVVLLRGLAVDLEDGLRGPTVLEGHGGGEGRLPDLVPAAEVQRLPHPQQQADDGLVAVLDGHVQRRLTLDVLGTEGRREYWQCVAF